MGGRAVRGIVFDLDGTLIDSAPDIAAALNGALQEAGLAALGLADVRGMIGSGATVLVERALGALGERAEAARVAGLVRRFEAHYLEVGAAHSRIFDGGGRLLEELSARGVPLGICTNKPDDVTQVVVHELGIAARFKAVRGVRAEMPRKPAPDMLIAVLDEMGCRAEEALMVGDSAIDVETARAAGVAIVLVSFGYTPVPARELGADAVVDRLIDVLPLLGR
ncbi:MAG: hypothetical protein RLZ98_2920 [Pseudomonadota bacterium]|jgi:phosphoglycolate phosphatase